jgi:uncharacterized protein GlcG (DUF336 family)
MREYIVATTMAVTLILSGTTAAQAWDDPQPASCQLPSDTVSNLQAQLATVVKEPDQNGGLFGPNRMWSAIVDRVGTLCSVIVTGDAWPGSRAIAIAKATTANGFSNDKLALSTANLYAPTQPGGSLYGLNDSNPFNPRFQPQGTGIGFVPGGIITFGAASPSTLAARSSADSASVATRHAPIMQFPTGCAIWRGWMERPIPITSSISSQVSRPTPASSSPTAVRPTSRRSSRSQWLRRL